MGTDDFSFPAITDPSPCFIASPALWRVSSRVLSDSCHEDHQKSSRDDLSVNKTAYHYQAKKFSSIDNGTKRPSTGASEDKEEKMDMLWEDFNDELHWMSKMKEAERLNKGGGSFESDFHAPRGMKEISHEQVLKVSTKPSNTMISHRRPSIMVIMKVVKKFLLLHSSRCQKNKD